jgi:hypothetical protein
MVCHDVGTPLGLGMGQPLGGAGIETPTLRAVWSSPPYPYHGGARTLHEVLLDEPHVGA